MERFIRIALSILGGASALYFQPALESTNNSFTGSLGITGQVVSLIWIGFTVIWAFMGAVAGHIVYMLGHYLLEAGYHSRNSSSEGGGSAGGTR